MVWEGTCLIKGGLWRVGVPWSCWAVEGGVRNGWKVSLHLIQWSDSMYNTWSQSSAAKHDVTNRWISHSERREFSHYVCTYIVPGDYVGMVTAYLRMVPGDCSV